MNVCLKQESQSSGCRRETNGESHWAESKERRNPSERRPSTQPHQVELREVLPSRGAGGFYRKPWSLLDTSMCERCRPPLPNSPKFFMSSLLDIPGNDSGTRKKANYTDVYPSSAPCCTSSGPRSTLPSPWVAGSVHIEAKGTQQYQKRPLSCPLEGPPLTATDLYFPSIQYPIPPQGVSSIYDLQETVTAFIMGK